MPTHHTISLAALLAVFKERVHDAGGYTAAARQLQISFGYLHDICTERRQPGDKALAAVGYEAIPPRFRKIS